MNREDFIKLAWVHAEQGFRIKATFPDGKKRNLWPGQGNVCGLHGESLWRQRGGKWQKSGERFKTKLADAVTTPGVLFEIQEGYSPDRIMMKYETIVRWTS